MRYHIDTAIIKDKFQENCTCPLCQIKSVIEEQLLYEFLNDAVMEDSTRAKVNKLGFCSSHFDMLFSRQNKLSLALQAQTRLNTVLSLFKTQKSFKGAKAQSQKILDSEKTCIICELTEDSMVKYYKTVAQLFLGEKEFRSILLKSNGFCFTHYAMLLKYSNEAGFLVKEYLDAISSVQNKALEKLNANLKVFCDKHDYRNASKPLGNAERALTDTREIFYGLKKD